MNSLTEQFIAEARDYLDEAARGLLALEQSAHDHSVINGIFRNFHTIKGTSGIFPEFFPITTLTHAAEDLMDQVRNNEREITTEMVDLFLAALDLVAGWLDDVERTGNLPHTAERSGSELRARIIVIRDSSSPAAVAQPVEELPAEETEDPRRDVISEWLSGISEELLNSFAEEAEAEASPCMVICYAPDQGCFFLGEDPVNLLRQIPRILKLEAITENIPEDTSEWDPYSCVIRFMAVALDSSEHLSSIFGYVEDQISVITLSQAVAQFQKPAAVSETVRETLLLDLSTPAAPQIQTAVETLQPAVETTRKTSAGTGFIRVDQHLINRFMDLVGEMIIAKNSLPFLCQKAINEYKVPGLADDIDTRYTTINHIVSGLQEIALEMRMLPVAKAFERFPRLVRDVSNKLGKKINLVMEGEETKADKDVIEALAEPLVHMVRNSLDHGIEMPELRISAGKPPEGTIILHACQENASIVVEIRDDGKGIDPAVIRRKAAEKGVATSEALDAMPDTEVIQLVMAPNFSTADAVSDLSGRGVGMDAVQTMVTTFGGIIHLSSVKGSGTTVRISLPLSMAITKVLIIRQGECTFGIPSDDVIESLIDIPLSMINTVNTSPGLNVRGNLYPLHNLSRQLEMDDADEWFREKFSAVVVKVRGEIIALAVEKFHDIIDVVVKPLGGMLARTPHYSGSTILGDGSIMFILNLPEVVADAR